tara:strand:- start:98 stop:205 length:108 start_codon:yes stop_codon:yes gene_type:complete
MVSILEALIAGNTDTTQVEIIEQTEIKMIEFISIS